MASIEEKIEEWQQMKRWKNTARDFTRCPRCGDQLLICACLGELANRVMESGALDEMAIVRNTKNDKPTVLTYAGMRFVWDHRPHHKNQNFHTGPRKKNRKKKPQDN